MRMSADVQHSFTDRFPKNGIPMAETSTSHSVRCYTTLWRVTQIFWVLHFPAGKGPSTSSTGSRRRRKFIPHSLWPSNSRSISKAHRLCGMGYSARPHLKESGIKDVELTAVAARMSVRRSWSASDWHCNQGTAQDCIAADGSHFKHTFIIKSCSFSLLFLHVIVFDKYSNSIELYKSCFVQNIWLLW